MHYTCKHSLTGVLLLFCASSFGQTNTEAENPRNETDTVYIGITNKIKLEQKLTRPESAGSVDARVSLKENELVILPLKVGEVVVDIIYKDTIVKRKFISTFLPKPTLPI